MLLSEAIRLGAMQGPQIHGRFVGLNNSSCALGAAAIAAGAFPSTVLSVNSLSAVFPGLKREVAMNLPGQQTPAPLDSAIIFLNDYLFRTRQDIADWIVANGYDCESVDLSVNVNTEQPKETVCV